MCLQRTIWGNALGLVTNKMPYLSEDIGRDSYEQHL